LTKFIDRRTDRAACSIADTGSTAACNISNSSKNVTEIAADLMTDRAECIAGATDCAGDSPRSRA
jgi:hypothetical protein